MPWFAILTCTFVAWTVWLRRGTLTAATDGVKLAEKTMTTSLILQIIAIFLAGPLSAETVGAALHAVTGQWNLDVWAGHCCLAGGIALIGVNVGTRLDITDAQLRAAFHCFFGLPMTVFVPVSLGLLTHSPNAARYWPDLFDSPTDWWLDAYWTLLAVFLIFLLVNIVLMLLVVGRDRRNRLTAALYIGACVMAILAGLLRIVTTWTDDNSHTDLFWVAACGIAALFGVAAARSWRQKIRRMSGAVA